MMKCRINKPTSCHARQSDTRTKDGQMDKICYMSSEEIFINRNPSQSVSRLHQLSHHHLALSALSAFSAINVCILGTKSATIPIILVGSRAHIWWQASVALIVS